MSVLRAVQSKRREKLIREAESFAAGCSRTRLELRLVDEIRTLETRVAQLEAQLSAETAPQEVRGGGEVGNAGTQNKFWR